MTPPKEEPNPPPSEPLDHRLSFTDAPPGEELADAEPETEPTPPAQPTADETVKAFEGILRPRKRQELLTEERLAQISEANFHGGIAANTLIITTGDGGEQLYRRGARGEANWERGLDQEALQRVTAVFDRPPPYNRAYACLQHNQLVIVHGPGGCGKSAAALYLAYDLQRREQVEIRKLAADTDLRRWSRSARVGRDTLYLIDGLVGTRSKEMPDHLWRELVDALKSRHAYLVISASQYVTFAAEAQAYLQVWEPPADHTAILQRHLRYYEVEEETVATWLSTDEVRQLLAKQPTPQAIYDLAHCLKGFNDGVFPSLAEALRALTISDEAAVAEWFGQAADDEERALWLALAIFNGSRFRLAQQAARLLADQIRATFSPPAAATPEPTPPKPWFQPLDDWRVRAGVELRLEDYGGQSVLPVEISRLNDPSLPQGILRYLWGRVPSFRPVLLEWLAQLGASDVSEVRIRAATAVAALAQLDYETVLRSVLERWGKESTPQTRQSLGHALRSLARSEQYGEATLLLLRDWAARGEKARVWAAARAYGLIGPDYPREAMDGWLGILARYDSLQHYRLSPTLRLSIIDPNLQPLFDSLFEAIASFFVASLAQPRVEFVRIYSQIVTALRVWLEEKDDGELFTLTSLLLFLGLMNLYIGEDSLASAEPGEAPVFQPQGAPALLVLVHFLDPQSPVLGDLAWLLERAIRTPTTRKEAIHGALHDWLVYLQATHDEQLYVSLRRVLRALARRKSFGHRWRREVGRPFEQWAARKPPSPRAAHTARRGDSALLPLPMAGRLVREVVELQG